MTQKQYEKLINKLKTIPKEKQPSFVNDFVNENLQYISDKENYGIEDYWPNINEVVKFEKEDCDGFAILKYKILKDVGFTDDEIGMIIFMNNNTGTAHMTAAVIKNDDISILDYGVLASHVFALDSLPLPWIPIVFFNKTKRTSLKEL